MHVDGLGDRRNLLLRTTDTLYENPNETNLLTVRKVKKKNSVETGRFNGLPDVMRFR